MNGKIWWVDLDVQGRIELPPDLRRRLGIGPGSHITLIMMNHSVYIHTTTPDDAVSEGPLPTIF